MHLIFQQRSSVFLRPLLPAVWPSLPGRGSLTRVGQGQLPRPGGREGSSCDRRVWSTLLVGLVLLLAGPAQAQNVPGAPSIDTVVAGSDATGLTLTVTWTAPATTGGAAITAYDLRSIETAADETAAVN